MIINNCKTYLANPIEGHAPNHGSQKWPSQDGESVDRQGYLAVISYLRELLGVPSCTEDERLGLAIKGDIKEAQERGRARQ